MEDTPIESDRSVVGKDALVPAERVITLSEAPTRMPGCDGSDLDCAGGEETPTRDAGSGACGGSPDGSGGSGGCTACGTGGNEVPPPPPPPPSGCTKTQGYWKNHEEAWPVSSLTIGGVSYSQEALLVLLATEPSEDQSLILAHQLIAALLNVASGATAPGALSDAQSWMANNADADGTLPYGVKSEHAVALSVALTMFNEGDGIVPACSDD